MTTPVRTLGPAQLLALGVNGIVGVGIFFVPAAVAAVVPGNSTPLVFLATGLALLPAAATFGRLGRRFDEDGGPVVYARAAFGSRAALLVGWVAYVSASFSTATVVVGLIDASVAPALGVQDALARRLLAVCLTLLLALVVASGLRVSARVWTSLTVLKLLPLLLLVAAYAASPGATSAPTPIAAPPDGGGWLVAALAVTFTLQGFEVVPVIAGQARTPQRLVPLATLGSLLIATALYVALAAACAATLPELAWSTAPLADAARVLGGTALRDAVTVGTSLSALGISFGMIVTTPRYLSSLASGEHLFGLDAVSTRGVPRRALAVTTLLVAAAVASGAFSELLALSSITVLAQFGVSAAALIALAFRRSRGFTPRDAWPALPTIAVALTLVLFGATAREALVGLAVLASGALLPALAPRHGDAG